MPKASRKEKRKAPGQTTWAWRLLAIILALFSFRLLGGTPPASLDASTVADLLAGERMYREGILPSGAPMESFVKGGIPVQGAIFACVSCHLRGGLGSFEGGVLTPAISGTKLFQPLARYYPFLEGEERKELPDQLRDVLRRPAYTETSLATAITTGLDSAGRPLSEVMPIYKLNEADTRVLVHYLMALSAEPSPGVTETSLKFATILTEEVSREDRQAFTNVIEHSVAVHNVQGENRFDLGYRAIASQQGALAFRRWSVTQWELKGPPKTWRRQLEAYYQKDPVFAVLGGISYLPWRPIHEFCEDHSLPCLFPLTDLPQLSGPGWYSLYFSKGLFQEGDAAAAYLSKRFETQEPQPILEVVSQTLAAQALASGFDKGWAERGHPPVSILRLRAGQHLASEQVLEALHRKPEAIVLLWTGPEGYRLLSALSKPSLKPPLVMMSTSYLREDLWQLPQAARTFTLLTYPYRLFRPLASMNLPAETTPETRAKLNLVSGDDQRRVRTRAFMLMKILSDAVTRMERNYYRDTLLDVIGAMMDQDESDYERLSFGPGQRYASKGCYVVQLPPGALHGFFKKSDWVIP